MVSNRVKPLPLHGRCKTRWQTMTIWLAVLVLLVACAGGDAQTDVTDAEMDSDASDGEASATAEPEVHEARLAYSTPEDLDHPVTVGAQVFADRLDELSNGQIKLEVFPGGALGAEADMLDMLQGGTLDMGHFVVSIPASSLGEPHLQAFTLPFLYPDGEALMAAWDSDATWDALAVFKEEHGFECVGLWDTDFRQLTSNSPVRSVEDLQGLRIRVIEGELFVQIWEAFGAQPTVMPVPEVYSALETGVVDATDIPWLGAIATKWAEVQDYATQIDYLNDPECFAVSNSFMEQLSPELQDAVRQAGRESGEASQQNARDGGAAAKAQMKEEYGIEFTEVDVDEFRDRVEPVYDQFYDRAGDAGRQLVEALREAMGQS